MKTSRFKSYGSSLTFTDLLFNLLLGFICLFVLSYLLINLETKKANIETKAEVVVTLTWNHPTSGFDDDVDLWIRDPNGNVAYFQDKATGLMHIDRDDLGYDNDTIIAADGTKIEFKVNQEIGTIRGSIKGEWVVNIHMYNKKNMEPTKVQVKIEKLNPVVKLVTLKEFTILDHGEEITVLRMLMSAEGAILSTDTTRCDLVKNRLQREH